MAAPKKPQDHQEKEIKPKVKKIDVTIGDGETERIIPARQVTLDGVTVTVQDRALNDYRVPTLLARGGENFMSANIQALDIILGAEQHDMVAERFQDEDGYVDQEKVGEFTAALLKALAPN